MPPSSADQTDSYRGRWVYDAGKAEPYQSRDPGKNAAELRLITRAFALVPKTHRVLDIPCGGGRVAIHLAKLGYQVSAADLSPAMLAFCENKVAASGLACPVEQQDVERLTYGAGAFDAIVCFRLFHHFPTPEIRRRSVGELCRVAKHQVVLSYFNPYSPTALQRKFRAATGGRRSSKYSTPLSEVASYFREFGFRLVKDFAQLRFLHTLHLAVFERVTAGLDSSQLSSST